MNQISQLTFKVTKDEDYPVDSPLVTFSPNAHYFVEGETHGLASHAVRHLYGLEREYFWAILEEALNEVRSFPELYLMKDNKVLYEGQAALRLLNELHVWNALDYLNDLIELKKPISEDEECLRKYLLRVTDRYVVCIKEHMDSSIEIEDISDNKIEEVLLSGNIIKFKAIQVDGFKDIYLSLKNGHFLFCEGNFIKEFYQLQANNPLQAIQELFKKYNKQKGFAVTHPSLHWILQRDSYSQTGSIFPKKVS